MQQTVVFVDAGYLFSQGAALLAGRKPRRERIEIDVPACVAFLIDRARDLSGHPLLRIYWYDAVRGSPSRPQSEIAATRDVKARWGMLSAQGVQKGVDSLIIADMITLSQRASIADAILVSGDEDLRVGVQLMQERGIRVHLVGVHPGRGTVSRTLIDEADTFETISSEDVARFMRTLVPDPPPSGFMESATAGLGAESRAWVIERALSVLSREQIRAALEVLERTGGLSTELDSRVLHVASRTLGRLLDGPEKRALRQEVREALRRAQGAIR